MNKYWNDREVVARQRLLNQTEEETLEVLRVKYGKVADRLIKKLLATYKDILLEDRPYKRYELKNLYKSLEEVEKELSNLNNSEVKLLDKQMKKLYRDITKTVGDELNLRLPLQKEEVEIAVNSLWVGDGQHFSNRFATSNIRLVTKLQDIMTQMVSNTGMGTEEATIELMKDLDPQTEKFFKSNGELVDKLSEELRKDFNRAYFEAERIIRTELAHIEISATLRGYERAGIHYYRWLTAYNEITSYNERVAQVNEARKEAWKNKKHRTQKAIPKSQLLELKGKVCAECLAMEDTDIGFGKGIYPIEYNDVPPKHPNCRCSILGIRDSEVENNIKNRSSEE